MRRGRKQVGVSEVYQTMRGLGVARSVQSNESMPFASLILTLEPLMGILLVLLRIFC